MILGWVRRVVGFDAYCTPPLPYTRKQLLIGGLVCLALHPGVALAAMSTRLGMVTKGDEVFIIINPWMIVTLLGIWLLLLAALSTQDRLNYKGTRKRKTHKERK